MLNGIAASKGISMAKAIVLTSEDFTFIENKDCIMPYQEISRFNEALTSATTELNYLWKQSKVKLGNNESSIFEAHLLILADPDLRESVENKILERKLSAEKALSETINELCTFFENSNNEYMKQRATDFRDIGKSLLNNLLGKNLNPFININEKCIIVAKDITPSDTIKMDFNNILGFITDIGGTTSHSAIIARSIELPAIVGVKTATANIKTGDFLILDGTNGQVHINPDANLILDYEVRKKESLLEKQKLLKYKTTQSCTIDGKSLELYCNIASPNEGQLTLDYGADGIGLFRTEFLFMDKNKIPDEEEQFNAYKEVAITLKNKPTIIRTLDIGGDKKLPYLPIENETNPFLGYRAIRLCLDKIDLFKTQLRAILRASVYGNIKIMFPMISTFEELNNAKEILTEVKTELEMKGIPYNRDIKVGIMIETPAAAIISDSLAKECDFFSIGTNDLLQYTVAVDRMNEKVSYLYNYYNPALIRLIYLVIQNAHANHIKVGICGEMAADPTLLPVYIGMDIDELSMNPSSILATKSLLTKLSYSNCKDILLQIINLKTCSEIKVLLDQKTPPSK